jgi:thiamine pyrophosphokinase
VGPHERVSVHSLLPQRFKRSVGLRYPLDSVRLAPGERTGTSNEAVDGPFRIEPEGKARPWMLILDRKYLFGVAAAATAMAG